MARNEQGNTSSAERPVLLATIGRRVYLSSGRRKPAARQGRKNIFICCSFLLPRTLKMKHLMKTCSTAIMAGAVSLAAWSPAHAQGEGRRIYSVYIGASGSTIGGEDWVDSVSKPFDTRFLINLKPDVPHELNCTATSRGAVQPPTFVPLEGIVRISNGSILVDSLDWNATNGSESPVAFDLICVRRDDS